MKHYTELRKFAYEKVGKEQDEQLKDVIINEKFRTWKDVVDIIIKDEQFMNELKQNIIEDILTSIREEPYNECPKVNVKQKSRFNFKIQEIYMKNQILMNKLRRYQFSINDDSIYEYNSLIYALIQIQKFSNDQILEMIR